MLESPTILFEIDSPLTTGEVIIRLQNVTEPRLVIRFVGAWGKRQKFEGLVTENWYDLHRILDGRRKFSNRHLRCPRGSTGDVCMGCLSLSRSTFRDQDVNAFYMTGWPYFITLCELGAGALLNARLLYLLDAFVRRKWCDA